MPYRSCVIAFGVLILGAELSRADDTARARQLRAEQRAEFAALPKVADPPTAAGANPIDALLDSWRAKNKVVPRDLCNDAELARRLWLDTVGLLPAPDQTAAFERAGDPAKVERLVQFLLDDRRGYTEHWMTFWNDLLRNDEQTAIDGLRKPITRWLFEALRTNMPYDQMVSELLNPGADGPDGYLKGVNWRGRVNLSQRPPVQAAQNVAQVFMATSIRCASCHDGFTTTWKLRDAYGLASFFSDETLEVARCDKPTGQYIPPKFLYPGLGEVAADADLPTRRAGIARMVTRPKNPRFARVIVNRLWARLLGKGLAEPVDELGEPECPELLDWLATDFMRHDYDLKHTIGQILTSRAYRMKTAAARPNAAADLAPIARRMTSEQFEDAIACVTGHWPKPAQVVGVPLEGDRVRAWRQKRPDPLLSALGRPNREQVVTKRSPDATILQALEVTNGVTLGQLLAAGAESLLSSEWGTVAESKDSIDELYRRAFSRPASPEERAIVAPLIGKPGDKLNDRKAGLEDALWLIVNSPEFQMIH